MRCNISYFVAIYICTFSELDILRGKFYFMWVARYPETSKVEAIVVFIHFPLVQTWVQNSFTSHVKVISISLVPPMIKKNKKNPDVFSIGLFFSFSDINALDSTGTES